MGTAQEIFRNIAERYETKPHGARGAYLDKMALDLGISSNTLRRRMKEAYGGGKSPAKRADAGKPRRPELYDYVRKIYELKARIREAGEDKRTLPTWKAIRILEQRGDMPKDAIGPGSVPRIARDLGLTGKRPCVRVDCETANHVHVFDGSGSEHIYVEKDQVNGEDIFGVRASNEKEQKNKRISKNKKNIELAKAEPARRMVYYFGLVDWHSRALYVEMHVTQGESLVDSVDFIDRAWREKERNPIVGIPDVLYTDNGPLGRCRESVEMATGLKYELLTHKPKNARAKATIERPWRTMWEDMELDFLLDKDRKYTLTELREILANYLEDYNERKSPGFYADGLSRREAYQKSLAARAEKNDVRLLPADMKLIEQLEQKDYRVVTSYMTIKWNNREYAIVDCPWILLEQKVECSRDIYGKVEIKDLKTGQLYQTKEFKPLSFGTYKAHKHNVNDEIAEAGSEMEPPKQMLYESRHVGGDRRETGGNAVDLAGAREVAIEREEVSPGFESEQAAVDYLIDEIDMPLWKLGPERDRKIRQFIADNFRDKAKMKWFAEKLYEALYVRTGTYE